jgi:hypothetical protein
MFTVYTLQYVDDTNNTAGKLLCVMLTYQCTAECAHCGTLSSPRDETWLPLDHALSAIAQAAGSGYAGVVFTGGEATLAAANLLECMQRASALGLHVRLVTNGHWAANDDDAESAIFEWMCAGLTELNVSTGDRHARFVPLDRALRAVTAAARLHLPVSLLVETTAHDTIAAAALRERLPDAVRILEWTWSSLNPFPSTKPAGAVNRSNLEARRGCDDLYAKTTIQANGAISPCCGLGIRLVPDLEIGRIATDSLAECESRAQKDALLQRIRAEGPERILAWAAARDPRIQWENPYAHRCQVCIRLFKDPLVRQVLNRAPGNLR